MYLLIVLESGKSKIKAELIPDEGVSSLLADDCILVLSHGGDRGSKLSGVSSYKDTNSIMRVPPS